MGAVLWPTELSRHGWPPRNRTARYLRIRQAPSTSWVVASGEGESRTRKAEAQLLSGQIPSPIGLPLHKRMVDGSNVRGSRRPDLRFPTGHLSTRSTIHVEEGGRLERRGINRASLSGRARHACPVHLP